MPKCLGSELSWVRSVCTPFQLVNRQWWIVNACNYIQYSTCIATLKLVVWVHKGWNTIKVTPRPRSAIPPWVSSRFAPLKLNLTLIVTLTLRTILNPKLWQRTVWLIWDGGNAAGLPWNSVVEGLHDLSSVIICNEYFSAKCVTMQYFYLTQHRTALTCVEYCRRWESLQPRAWFWNIRSNRTAIDAYLQVILMTVKNEN